MAVVVCVTSMQSPDPCAEVRRNGHADTESTKQIATNRSENMEELVIIWGRKVNTTV